MLFRIEEKGPRIINILTAPKEDLEPLRERVSPEGSIRIMMHSFFLEHSQDSANHPRIAGYQKERDKVFQASSKEPLIVVEEAWLVKALPRRLRGITPLSPKQIYVCTTEYNSPTPRKPGIISLGTERPRPFIGFLHRLKTHLVSPVIDLDRMREGNWDELARILEWLRVKNVSLGGQYLTYFNANKCTDPRIIQYIQKYLEKLEQPGSGKLYIPDDAGEDKLIPTTCVGWAALCLAYRGFNVSLTLPSSPKKIISLS